MRPKRLDLFSTAKLEAAIIKSLSFARLKEISFLGVIDHLNVSAYKNTTNKYSRAEHTLAVCNHAKNICTSRNFSNNERQLIVSVALCHDIGHLAFSHTTEHVAKELGLGVNHKTRGADIISGEDEDIFVALNSANIDYNRLVDIANGNKDDPLNWIFHAPINIDTIDGMSRFLHSFKLNLPFSPDTIVKSLISLHENTPLDEIQIRQMDIFWEVKKSFYEAFLINGIYAEYERQFINFLKTNIGKNASVLIELSERQILEETGWSTHQFNRNYTHRKKNNPKWNFFIDYSAKLNCIQDLERRYIRIRNEQSRSREISSTKVCS